jgi:rod shape determining protein RodA
MSEGLASLSLRQREREGFDLLLFGSLTALGLLGAMIIYSATREQLLIAGFNPHFYLERQLGFVIGGIVLMWLVSLIDYRKLEVVATPIYIGSVLSLAGVFVVGQSALGAQRWYNLGFMQVQPSEFTVLGIILAVATFCGRRSEGLRMYDIWRLLVMAGAPIGLIVLQPDLGTSIIIVLVVAGMMIIAGVPPRFLSFLAVAGSIGLAGAIYFDVLQKYQVDRFVSFLNQNSTNANIQALLYEVANAKAAIGAGGFSGAGLFHGMQTMLGYVPEQSTDFIFTAVGEQFGFLGAVSLIALFAFVGWRIWSIGRSARDTMGRVLCIGIFIFFAFSCFENMGMTMGITPVTGIPLPFISYGGSAVMVFFIAGGVVLSISRRSGG